ncbi:MAG: hypothetical protein J6J23_06100 [Clostridia bacterium]|nr:hypothetical protein [Clostridia bacterium]
MNDFSMNICEYYHKCVMLGIRLPDELAMFASDKEARVLQISQDMIAVIYEVNKTKAKTFGVKTKYAMVTVSERDLQNIAESNYKDALIKLYPQFIISGLVNVEFTKGNLATRLRFVAKEKLPEIESAFYNGETVNE